MRRRMTRLSTKRRLGFWRRVDAIGLEGSLYWNLSLCKGKLTAVGANENALRMTVTETLVLYRTRPKHSECAGGVGAARRVRYSGLKEAAPGEAIMPIQSCWGLGG